MSRRIGAVFVLLAAFTAALPTGAWADVSRVSGPYRMTVSFMNAPVYPLERNVLVIQVNSAETGVPVEGLESLLRMRISMPNQASATLPIEPAPGEPGRYRVNLALPRAGTVNFDLFGTVDGRQVFERFVSGEDGLEPVIPSPRSYPRGSLWVVFGSLALYLIGVAVLTGHAGIRRWRGRGRGRGRRQATTLT